MYGWSRGTFCCRWMLFAPRNLVTRRLPWICIFCSFEWALPWNVGPFLKINLLKKKCSKIHITLFKGNIFVVRGHFCMLELGVRGLAWKCIGLEPTLSKIVGPFFENQLAEEQMFQNACMVDPGEHFAVDGCFLHNGIWWVDGCFEYSFFAALS